MDNLRRLKYIPIFSQNYAIMIIYETGGNTESRGIYGEWMEVLAWKNEYRMSWTSLKIS